MAADNDSGRPSRRGFLRKTAGLGFAAFVGLASADAMVEAVAERVGGRALGEELAQRIGATPAALAGKPTDPPVYYVTAPGYYTSAPIDAPYDVAVTDIDPDGPPTTDGGPCGVTPGP